MTFYRGFTIEEVDPKDGDPGFYYRRGSVFYPEDIVSITRLGLAIDVEGDIFNLEGPFDSINEAMDDIDDVLNM